MRRFKMLSSPFCLRTAILLLVMTTSTLGNDSLEKNIPTKRIRGEERDPQSFHSTRKVKTSAMSTNKYDSSDGTSSNDYSDDTLSTSLRVSKSTDEARKSASSKETSSMDTESSPSKESPSMDMETEIISSQESSSMDKESVSPKQSSSMDTESMSSQESSSFDSIDTAKSTVSSYKSSSSKSSGSSYQSNKYTSSKSNNNSASKSGSRPMLSKKSQAKSMRKMSMLSSADNGPPNFSSGDEPMFSSGDEPTFSSGDEPTSPAPVASSVAPSIAPIVTTPVPTTAAPITVTPDPTTVAPITPETVAPVPDTPQPTPLPTLSPVTLSPTPAPVTPSPTPAPVTPSPTLAPVTLSPTLAPVTASPTLAPVTASPTSAPVTASPTLAPVTASPTPAPVTPSPTSSPVTAQPTPAPVTPRPTPLPTPVPTLANAYNIDLSYATNVPTALQSSVRAAADRIESFIVGDLSPQGNIAIPDDYQCPSAPTIVDDMWLCAQVGALPEFVDGQGGFDMVRIGENDLPYVGFITISTEVPDPPIAVLIHEMLHAVGFGTLWTRKELISGRSAPCNYLSTSAATAEYQSISGCSAGTELPISQGNDCQHWDETCFVHELMTPTYLIDFDGSVPFQLSSVTVAAMQDLGYTVDFDAADPYTSANMDASCVCNAGRGPTTEKETLPALSDELHERATEYGKRVLEQKHKDRQRRLQANPALKNEELAQGGNYVGDQVMFLLVRENGVRHTIIVTQSYDF